MSKKRTRSVTSILIQAVEGGPPKGTILGKAETFTVKEKGPATIIQSSWTGTPGVGERPGMIAYGD